MNDSEIITALENAEHMLGQAWACIEHIKDRAPDYERKAAIALLKDIAKAGEAARIALAKAEGRDE